MRDFMRWLRRASREYELTWRLYNLGPALSYRHRRGDLHGERARVVQELNQKGIATTSVSQLLGTDSCYSELQAVIAEEETQLAEHLAQARRKASEQQTGRQKPYLFELLGQHPVLDKQSVFARFALQQPIVDVANAYFGMYVRLRYYNVWYNFPTDAEPSQSQLWHRDPEDRYILKVFVCLTPVDDDNGPFTYAAGTHAKGPIRGRPAFSHMDGQTPRTNDLQMKEFVPPSHWVKGVGPAGTMFIADTRGYHKGGLARKRDRLLYTCEFTSWTGGSGGLSTAHGYSASHSIASP